MLRVALAKLPGPHWRHPVRPASLEYVPAAQSAQAVAPLNAMNVPIGQLSHCVFADAFEKVPCAQREQLEPPMLVEYKPGMHS